MSDISIRFDGLALLATLASSVLGYVVIALFALIRRHRQIALRAALMALGTALLTIGFFTYWVSQGTAKTGPDLVDALIIPWAVLFLAGCWHLAKTTRR